MLIELSYQISKDMPVYPGSPSEDITFVESMDSGSCCNTSIIHHYIHAGTHIDAPYHFDNDGCTIDELPIESFLYEFPVFIDCPLSKSGLITRAHIESISNARKADILILNTGYSANRKDAAVYCDDFPALSEEAALYVRNELLNVKALAIDTLSIESAIGGPANNFPVHRSLLDGKRSKERTLIIFEDVNTAALYRKKVHRIYGFPLRLKGFEGSPVTIVAEVE